MSTPISSSLPQHWRVSNRCASALVAGAAALGVALTAAPASAASGLVEEAAANAAGQAVGPLLSAPSGDRVVDPLSLTPALNPTFTWSCARTGSGITCTGERRTTYGPEPTGFDCDGMPVFVSGRGDDRMTRWHDAEGLATRTITQRSFPEDRLTLSADGSGPAVVSRQHWTQHYDYGTPGDVSTRVLVETGQVLLLHGPGGAGKLFQLTGRTEFAAGKDFEEVVSFHGRDDFAAGQDFVAEVCGALT